MLVFRVTSVFIFSLTVYKSFPFLMSCRALITLSFSVFSSFLKKIFIGNVELQKERDVHC